MQQIHLIIENIREFIDKTTFIHGISKADLKNRQSDKIIRKSHSMKTTTVSQLKMSLSAYLRQVKTGEEVLITKHGRPIARLLPIRNPGSLSEHLQDMERKGLLKRGEKPLPADFWNLPRPADPRGAVRSAVLSEREQGR